MWTGPKETLINLNFPHIDINDNPEIRVVKQGKRDRSYFGTWRNALTHGGAAISGIDSTGWSMRMAIWFTRPAKPRILRR